MGDVKIGRAPDGTVGVVLGFDDPTEENEWRDQSRRKENRKPDAPEFSVIEGGNPDER